MYDQKKIDDLILFIENGRKIFVAGIGRSGLVAKAFAMRLMHLGYSVFVMGETITPRVEKDDLLIAISGSGETGYVVGLSKKAKELGAKVVAITSSVNSRLSKIADFAIILKSNLGKEIARVAPLGTIFELKALFFLEGIVAEIMERKNMSEEDLAKRHSIENEVSL